MSIDQNTGDDKTTPESETNTKKNIGIDQKLIEEGTIQLTSEIEVLEAWLRELKNSADDDSEVTAARKSYSDMLSSRKEMLSTLARQSKLQAVSAV